MSPRRRRTQARFRIALRDNPQLHLFAEASPPAAIDNLKSFHSALSVLTSIRTVSAKSDNSYKAAHLGCVRKIHPYVPNAYPYVSIVATCALPFFAAVRRLALFVHSDRIASIDEQGTAGADLRSVLFFI
ncbi:hypothetical protein ACI2KT_36275 [Ensifer adhaerens]|uniref:hypothetical protein n=1 Tax=Ensifer adhaerens TaxID=106592 RepID=UPI00384C37F9